jgi:cell division protein FtsN
VVEVGAYSTRSDAELARSALTGAGIAAVIASDDAGGAYPFALAGAARVLVDEADAENAVKVLAGNGTE